MSYMKHTYILMSIAGESYSASGINYERLQEEVSAKELNTVNTVSRAVADDSAPSTNSVPNLSTTSTTIPPAPPIRARPDENNHRRDDIMYFSIE